jgi:peptidyl-prolyl cis-trans isomerase C
MLPYPSRKKKSKKLFVVATIAAACIFSGSYYVLTNTSSDEVVAKINGQKIYKSEIELRLHDVFEGQSGSANSPELSKLPKEIIEILAKEVYLEKELTKEALRSDAVKTPEVKEKIADSKNKILRQAYIDSIIKKEITDDKINNKYLELSKELEGKKEYQIFHIVVKTKEEAEKIAKELKYKRSPSKFAELAKKYSIDQETATKGGEIDYTLEDSMIKEIAAVVTSLEKDQISDPIETKFGWHLVKVGDVREAKALSFESVKDNIRDQLIQDRVNEINNKIINNAKVQILIQLSQIEKSKVADAAPQDVSMDAAPEEKADPNVKVADAPTDWDQKIQTNNKIEVVSNNEEPSEEVKEEAQTDEEKDEVEKSADNKNKSHAKQKKHKKSKR